MHKIKYKGDHYHGNAVIELLKTLERYSSRPASQLMHQYQDLGAGLTLYCNSREMSRNVTLRNLQPYVTGEYLRFLLDIKSQVLQTF